MEAEPAIPGAFPRMASDPTAPTHTLKWQLLPTLLLPAHPPADPRQPPSMAVDHSLLSTDDQRLTTHLSLLLLPTTDHSLLSLPTTDHSLLTTHYSLLTTHYSLLTTQYH